MRLGGEVASASRLAVAASERGRTGRAGRGGCATRGVDLEEPARAWRFGGDRMRTLFWRIDWRVPLQLTGRLKTGILEEGLLQGNRCK